MTAVVLEQTDLTADEARQLTDRLRTNIGNVVSDVTSAHAGRAWLALGYARWNDYVSAELGGALAGLDRLQRLEVVGELRDTGMSQRAIGAALGVDQKTISNDLRQRGEESSSPAVVTGLDGKNYSPVPEREPRRRPLPEAFFTATYDLVKDAEKVARLLADDRLPEHRDALSTKHRDDLFRAMSILNDALTALDSPERMRQRRNDAAAHTRRINREMADRLATEAP